MAVAKKDRHDASVHLGIVVAAVAAIAAGAYFFATKQGKKQRAMLQDWVVRAEKDVLKHLEGIPHLNQEAFEAVIDTVLANYKKAKKVDVKAIEGLRGELHGQWKGIARGAKRAVSKAKKAVR